MSINLTTYTYTLLRFAAWRFRTQGNVLEAIRAELRADERGYDVDLVVISVCDDLAATARTPYDWYDLITYIEQRT